MGTALEQPDKILFIRSIQSLPLLSQKDAEFALYRKQSKSAENILLQNDLIYRAIELNMRLFRWRRALELAVDHNSHIETVVAFRNSYLQTLKKQETIDLFIEYNEKYKEIDWSQIEEKCRNEMDAEYQMAGIKRKSNQKYHHYLSFLFQQNNNHRKIKQNKNGRQELEALLDIHSNDNHDDDDANIIDID